MVNGTDENKTNEGTFSSDYSLSSSNSVHYVDPSWGMKYNSSVIRLYWMRKWHFWIPNIYISIFRLWINTSCLFVLGKDILPNFLCTECKIRAHLHLKCSGWFWRWRSSKSDNSQATPTNSFILTYRSSGTEACFNGGEHGGSLLEPYVC